MKRYRRLLSLITLCCAAFLCPGSAGAQQPVPSHSNTGFPQEVQSDVDALLRQLAAHEARIKELEARLDEAVRLANKTKSGQNVADAAPVGVTLAAITLASAAPDATPAVVRQVAPVAVAPIAIASSLEAAAPIVPAADPAAMAMVTPVAPSLDVPDPHDHMLNMPGGGPALKIRGFADFNYGMGSMSNPLIYPLGAPTHDTFQAGEFDLFISSKLSNRFSFVGEIIFGSDRTNVFGLDIERYELTYKQSKYFEISAGRYHSSIGYYNTAYHHGTWFGTATGRPFMYYYEDSGGMLPVHNVGLQATGLMPGTGRLNLHWVAELGNGRSSDPNAAAPVQNFLSDRNRKSVNFAMYIKPEWLEGIQLGGSFYDDRLYPNAVTAVNQRIGSFYAVYFKNGWESLNEGVLLQNRSGFDGRTYNTPLMYTQISRQFGRYVPYFRFQYVNAPVGDPVNVFAGRYEGPSEGIRYNVSDYAALKLQYNRVYGLLGSTRSANGLDANLSFTF